MVRREGVLWLRVDDAVSQTPAIRAQKDGVEALQPDPVELIGRRGVTV